MSIVKIVLYRHASAIKHDGDKISGQTFNGELSEKGYNDTYKLCEDEDFSKYDIIASSDLLRAMQTAAIATSFKRDIMQRADFREIHFGNYENRRFADLNKEQGYLQAVMQNPHAIQSFNASFPNGESHQDVVDRVTGGLRQLIESVDNINSICLFTHGGVISIMIKLLQEIWPESLKNLEYIEIYYNRDTEKFFM